MKQQPLFDLSEVTETVIPIHKEVYMVSTPSLGTCMLRCVEWLSRNPKIKIESVETTADNTGWSMIITYE